MSFTDIIYDIARTWVMALFCFAIAGGNLYLSRNQLIKQWPKRIKAANWLILGLVYLADHIWNPLAVDIRVYYRLALFLMFMGEVGYHFDTFQDIGEAVTKRIRRRS